MEAIQGLSRLHQIKQEREEIQEKISRFVDPLQTQLTSLDAEEADIRKKLEEEAIQQNGKLSYPALGSVSVTEKEKWEITDKNEAQKIVEENPVFFSAQNIGVKKPEFIKIAQELFEETGEMISCVDKVSKRTTTFRLAKIELDDDDTEDDSQAS